MTSLDLSGISGAHVVVTGGAGLIGTFASSHLLDADAASVTVVDRRPWDGNPAADSMDLSRRLPHDNIDLRVPEAVDPVVEQADVVYHLAGETQGIGFSAQRGFWMMQQNAEIDLAMLGALARRRSARPLTLVAVSSSCVYPASAPQPIREDAASLECEPGNEGYGFAKLILERGVTELTRQGSGITPAVVRLANAYGESYRWKGVEQSHLVPSLVYKAATNPVLSVWGDGTQQRDLLHASDIARAILAAGAKAAATGEAVGPMNLAGGEPTSVKDLAEALAGILGCEKIEYDTTKPSGNKAKTLDLGVFRATLADFAPEIDLRAGLERMVEVWLPRVRAAQG